MKLLLVLLLFPAAWASASPIKPLPSGRTVAMGTFQLWFPEQRRWNFVSGGLSVTIEPAPCDAAHPTEGCQNEPVNNQAIVTIAAPGMKPFHIETDRQSSYYRVAVVWIDRHDPRPGVIVENDSGGSAGLLIEYVLQPSVGGFTLIDLDPRRIIDDRYGHRQGLDSPRDLSGDGVIDLVLGDGRFSPFGCNACTPRPPLIFTIRDGKSVDVSREPAFAAMFRRDMAEHRVACASHHAGRNGACVTYAADAARVGRFEQAMRNVSRWYERNDQWGNGTHFPTALRGFLRIAGYVG